VEFSYYSTSDQVGRKDICAYCATPVADRDRELLQKFKIVLPWGYGIFWNPDCFPACIKTINLKLYLIRTHKKKHCKEISFSGWWGLKKVPSWRGT
jgi:hypothetical protein